MKPSFRHFFFFSIPFGLILLATLPLRAEEIRIGNTTAYSGPAAIYGAIAKTQSAYLDMINREHLIGEHTVKFLTFDDAYNPAQTLPLVRRLVEQHQVHLLFGILGTAPNLAIGDYLTEHKVPNLFLNTGMSRLGDPKKYPYNLVMNLSYELEGRMHANFILSKWPKAKVAVLYQSDDFGKEGLEGLKAGLGSEADKMIVRTESYLVTDPSVESQISLLKNSGAEILICYTLPKQTIQALKFANKLGWKPVRIVTIVSSNGPTVMKPLGDEIAKDVYSMLVYREPTDPRIKDSADLQRYFKFMKAYYPQGDPLSTFNVTGFVTSELLLNVLKRLVEKTPKFTTDAIMDAALNIKKFKSDLLYPNVEISTGANQHIGVTSAIPGRWNGTSFVDEAP